MKRVSNLLVIALVTVILTSIACVPGKQTLSSRDQQLDDRIKLEERMREYMTYRAQGRFDMLYEMLTPAFRKETTLKQFLANPLELVKNFSAYSLDRVDFTAPDRATIYYSEQSTGGTFGIFLIKPGVPAEWEKVDGIWYHSELKQAPLKPIICGSQQTWPPQDFNGSNSQPQIEPGTIPTPPPDYCGGR